MKKTSLKRIIIWRVIGVVIIVILFGGIFVLGSKVQGARRGLLVKQLSLEGSLKAAVYHASLQEQLVNYRIEIDRVEQMMPIEDEIGSIVSLFEAEAKKAGVIVKVPTVQEEVVLDKNGDKVEQIGFTRAVRMQIHAEGDPIALIGFMHTIEHLPFLLGTVSFVFISDADSVSGGTVFVVPGSRPPGAEPEQQEVRRASLRMEVKLTTRVEGNTK